MKTKNLFKSLLVVMMAFAANVTIFAASPETELVYNTEEVDGMKLSETVYKMNEGILTNYEKYNYTYNDNKQVVESKLQKWDGRRNEWRNHLCIKYAYKTTGVTIQYYKWNESKQDFILIPDMTVTMEQ